jgi:hypothetical protein
VNRCLSEGRARFVTDLARIESGAECERLAPLLSALVDGEAGADDVAALRPHLRTCLACRARLREYREAPAKAAALVPPVAAVPLVIGWLHERAASLATRWHAALEAASASKIAAVTASTALLAGGGVATVTTAGGTDGSRPAPHAVSRPAPERPAARHATSVAVAPARKRRTKARPRPAPAASPPATDAPEPAAPERQTPPAPGEFEPAPAAEAPRGEQPSDPPAGEAGEFAP